MTWTLHHADCLGPEGMATLPDGSVDVALSDPPYDEHTHAACAARRGCTSYAESKRGGRRAEYNRARELGFDAITQDEMEAAADQFARVVRRWVLVFCSVEMIHDWKGALTSAGLEYVRTVVWHKLGCTPQMTGDRPAQAVEAIVCAHRPGRKRWNAGGKHGYYAHASVLNRGGHKERVHTTQKPELLLRDLVVDFSDPGELILDAYAGSGTTGAAALKLGRRFIGWERDEKYHAVASTRLEAVEPDADEIALGEAQKKRKQLGLGLPAPVPPAAAPPEERPDEYADTDYSEGA